MLSLQLQVTLISNSFFVIAIKGRAYPLENFTHLLACSFIDNFRISSVMDNTAGKIPNRVQGLRRNRTFNTDFADPLQNHL